MKRVATLLLGILLVSPGLLAQEASRDANTGKASDSTGSDELYKLGPGITAPMSVYAPDPEYTDKARKKKVRGNVILSTVVGTDGLPRDIKIKKGLTSDLDNRCIDTLKKWKFTPGMKDGHAVAVALDIEMTFNLY